MKLIKIEKEEDYRKLMPTAKPIWEKTYSGVIPPEQIAFLLDKYFSLPHLAEYRQNGYEYYWIQEENNIAGFTAYKVYPDHIYLDKLYLKEEFQHKGIGKAVFDELLRKYGKDLVLNVNQHNSKAVKAYLASGFEIIEEQTIPLEGKLINVDFVMKKRAK
jgi:ribosomal protein S18 acetylase RimI-like enzyme